MGSCKKIQPCRWISSSVDNLIAHIYVSFIKEGSCWLCISLEGFKVYKIDFGYISWVVIVITITWLMLANKPYKVCWIAFCVFIWNLIIVVRTNSKYQELNWAFLVQYKHNLIGALYEENNELEARSVLKIPVTDSCIMFLSRNKTNIAILVF